MRRRESMKVEPIRVVSASLVSRPVDSATQEPHHFARVLSTARESIEARARKEYGAESHRQSSQHQQSTAASNLSILQSKDAADLYARLDTLLREKSVLIAIA